jgi:hypothetical protein
MGCKNCGGGNRHKKKVPLISKGVDRSSVPDKTSAKTPLRTEEMVTPEQAFQAAREMSYEEITDRMQEQQNKMDDNSEQAIHKMTPAMKKYHVLSLLGIYNFDITSMTGISPGQALIGLKKVLEREDFKDINEMYPNLKDKVTKRVERMMQDRIIIE